MHSLQLFGDQYFDLPPCIEPHTHKVRTIHEQNDVVLFYINFHNLLIPQDPAAAFTPSPFPPVQQIYDDFQQWGDVARKVALVGGGIY